MLPIPERSEVIRQVREAGGRVAAVLPIHYPRELLRACGLSPVEVWGPPGVDTAGGDARFQAYACPVVRNATRFLAAGGLDVADVLLVPHTCDALQGMGSVLQDFGGASMPVATLYLPRARRPADHAYLAEELRGLARRLSEVSGVTPSDDDLQAALEAEAEADGELARLALHRGECALDDRDLYRLLRAREYLPAETFSEVARSAPGGSPPVEGTPLFLSGIVPEPPELFDVIRQAGGRVVGDDLACVGRRLYPAGAASDPWERMAERLLDGPPCSTRGSPISERAAALATRMQAAGARGLLVVLPTFCEPELFDLPHLRRALGEHGKKLLDVEVELGGSFPGQVATRIQAFVEML